MKKYLLSGFTVASFLLYGFYQRVNGATQNSPVPESPLVPVPNASSLTEIFQSSPSPSVVGNTPKPSMLNTPKPSPRGMYKDGTYTGSVADAFYGNIQVQALISGGKLSDVVFLQYPNDRSHSIEINSYAMPILKQEALQAQNAKVDIVSGATASSQAFTESLNSALSQAL